MSDDLPTLSVVVPVYRSRECLAPLVARLEAAMDRAELGPGGFEVVLVNDGSPDDSWSEIVRLSSSHPCVRGLSLSRNFGQHNATMAGLRESRGLYVVVMDDDLQHPPEAVPAIFERLRDGADVCFTTYRDRQHALWKTLGSRINDLFATWLLDKPRGVYLSSFKGMSRMVVEAICRYDGPFTYVDGLILDVTRNVESIEIQHTARLAGQGNYNLRRSVGLWLRMVTSFSVLPLRMASLSGGLMGMVAAALACFLAVEVLLHGAPVPGWASTMVAILLVGSVQLIAIGVIGEYVGRAYLRLNNSPQYVVRSRVGKIGGPPVSVCSGVGYSPTSRRG